MLKVTSTFDIWRLCAFVTVFALSVVTAVLILLYPREEWLWEISVSWPLTSLLSLGVTALIGRQMLCIHDLNNELQQIVRRDRLTDAATRDFFFERMEHDPGGYGVSLMVDIDHFKRVNDTYGHYVGDVVIKRVSDILRQETRPQDIVCRFGGEEFVVFLHEANSDDGHLVAERMRRSVEAALITSGEATVAVTVSIGGALKDRVEDINISIQQADDALYRAKRGGRNRTVLDWISPQAPEEQRRAS